MFMCNVPPKHTARPGRNVNWEQRQTSGVTWDESLTECNGEHACADGASTSRLGLITVAAALVVSDGTPGAAPQLQFLADLRNVALADLERVAVAEVQQHSLRLVRHQFHDPFFHRGRRHNCTLRRETERANLPRMSPQVEAAWIAALTGGIGIISTAVVAVIGLRNTRKAVTAQIEADRRNRIWDKRAAAYADAIAGHSPPAGCPRRPVAGHRIPGQARTPAARASRMVRRGSPALRLLVPGRARRPQTGQRSRAGMGAPFCAVRDQLQDRGGRHRRHVDPSGRSGPPSARR
jgi:hypothetical protein